MYRFNAHQVEEFLREKKLIGEYKRWVKDEEVRRRVKRRQDYFESLTDEEKARVTHYNRVREACGKTARWANIWMDKTELGFIIYKANRDRDFVYVVYDVATDYFSPQLPYVADVNEYVLFKYNFVTGRKSRGGNKNGKAHL